MGLSISHGIPFHGQAVQQGAVVYVCNEGVHGIGKRIAGWRRAHGIPDGDFSPIMFSTEPFNLVNLDDVLALARDARKVAEKRGATIRLVVVDTLSKALQGAAEDEQGIGKAIANADVIRQELEANVLLVHHTGKDQSAGARGSSLIGANVDSMFRVSRELNQPRIAVTCEKQKDAEDGWQAIFEAEKISLPPVQGADHRARQVTLALRYIETLTPDAVTDRRRERAEFVKLQRQEDKYHELREDIARAMGKPGVYSLAEVSEAMGKARGGFYKQLRQAITPEPLSVRAMNGYDWTIRLDNDRVVIAV
jgi:RecA-family ATPase